MSAVTDIGKFQEAYAQGRIKLTVQEPGTYARSVSGGSMHPKIIVYGHPELTEEERKEVYLYVKKNPGNYNITKKGNTITIKTSSEDYIKEALKLNDEILLEEQKEKERVLNTPPVYSSGAGNPTTNTRADSSFTPAPPLAPEETIRKPVTFNTNGYVQTRNILQVETPTRQEQFLRDFNMQRAELKQQLFTNQDTKPVNLVDIETKLIIPGVILLDTGLAKGVVGTAKDIFTGQIIPKTTDFLTATASNPKGVIREVKMEFGKNPLGFAGEQIGSAFVMGKVISVAKKPGDFNPVKTINQPGDFTKLGTPAEYGQRVWYQGVNIKNWVGELSAPMFTEGLGLNKKGQVNNPGKRRISKADLRFQSNTGFTKGQINKGAKPSQGRTTTEQFTYKDLLRNQELQGRVANFDYPNNFGEYKKFSLIKENQKFQDNVPLPRSEMLTLRRKRGGYSGIETKNINVPGQSFQSTTKSVKVFEGVTESGQVLQQGYKVRVKYKYGEEPKKPKLNFKKPEVRNQKIETGKPIELVVNVDKAGQEIYSPISEPLQTTQVKGFRNTKIRESLIARIKAKREAQIKQIDLKNELERQRQTLPAVQGNKEVYNYPSNKKSVLNNEVRIDKDIASLGQGKEIGSLGSKFNNPFKRKRVLANQYFNYQEPYINYAPKNSPVEALDFRNAQMNNRVILPQMGNAPLLAMRQEQNLMPKQIINPAIGVKNDLGIYQRSILSQKQVIIPIQAPVQRIDNIIEQSKMPRQSQILEQKQINTPDKNVITRNPVRETPKPPIPKEPLPSVPITPIFKTPREFIPREPIIRTPRPPKPKEPKPPIPRVSREKNVFGKPFRVEVRKKKKFLGVGEFGSEAEAFNFGKLIVGNSASASLRVKNLETGSFEKNKNVLSDKQFYASQKEKGVYVERRSQRIKSSGEKQEISFKGLQALRNKRILN